LPDARFSNKIQGCRIFLGKKGQKWKHYTKLTTTCTKRPLNIPSGLEIPNAHKIYQNLSFQGLKTIPKFEFLV
jgi:hypothetical protein